MRIDKRVKSVLQGERMHYHLHSSLDGLKIRLYKRIEDRSIKSYYFGKLNVTSIMGVQDSRL